MKNNTFAFTMKSYQETTNSNFLEQLSMTNKQVYMNNILWMIDMQTRDISMNIELLKINQMEIEKELKGNQIIFTRIFDTNNRICKNCKRSAVYLDNETNYYCWFHRLEIEN